MKVKNLLNFGEYRFLRSRERDLERERDLDREREFNLLCRFFRRSMIDDIDSKHCTKIKKI